MTEIDYSQDAKKVRWPKLFDSLKKMSQDERRKILLAATDYKSGEDSCGSIYMGGMAHASLRRVLGSDYPGTKPYRELIWIVSEEVLNAGIWDAMHTIEYMLAHPRKKCPCCGQVVPK